MNAIVVQCGGPTSVINASLWGVIAACGAERGIDRLWGARLGLRGLVHGDWTDLTGYRDPESNRLAYQPGAALGGGRYRLGDEDVPGLLARLQQRQIGAVFVIGGNGSMAAAQRLLASAEAAGYSVKREPLRVIGIPKTVDNDLIGTDFCPGYPSAARFVVQSTHDVGLDLYSMRDFDDVVVLEVMGRHVGWLAAASALARWHEGTAPHLVLLPEVALDVERFIAAVQRQHDRSGICLVVAAEGVKDTSGAFLAEYGQSTPRDASGQKMLGFAPGVARTLAGLIGERLGLRCRQLRPDTIQRSSSILVSPIDRQAAEETGRAAVHAAMAGASGIMIGLERQSSKWHTVQVPLISVIGREKPLPAEFIAPDGFDVTPAFLDYARPLIGEPMAGAVQL